MEIIYSSKYIRILGKVYYITLPSILYYFAKYIILLCQVYYITVFSVSLDGGEEIVSEYQTKGRSEEWKINVLGNHATRVLTLPMPRTANHTLTVKAIDEGVVLDQICVMSAKRTK